MASLYDKLTRYSVYLEHYKDGETANYIAVYREIIAQLQADFATLDYDQLDALTKAQLRTFLRKVKHAQLKKFNTYTRRLENNILNFMQADREISTAIMQDETGLAPEEATGKPLIGLATLNDDDKLAAFVRNAIVPASGLLMAEMLKNFANSSVLIILNRIRIGYANREKWTGVLRDIVGTSKNRNRDGKLFTTIRRAKALTATLIQHVHSKVSSAVKSIYFEMYIWDSVIDSSTTDICRERNQNVYEFGKGPIPPAHWACRSNIIPFTKKIDVPNESFYSWLVRQPKNIQNDINPGGLKMNKFVSVKSISLSGLKNKLGSILQ